MNRLSRLLSPVMRTKEMLSSERQGELNHLRFLSIISVKNDAIALVRYTLSAKEQFKYWDADTLPLLQKLLSEIPSFTDYLHLPQKVKDKEGEEFALAIKDCRVKMHRLLNKSKVTAKDVNPILEDAISAIDKIHQAHLEHL